MSSLVRLSLGASIGNGTFSIRRDTDQATYGASNLFVTTNPPEGPEYIFTTNGTPQGGVLSRLLLLKNSNAAERATYTGPRLDNVSYAFWERFQRDPVFPVNGQTRHNSSVFGSQTSAADVPTSGTYAYDAILIGRLANQINSSGGITDVRLTGSAAVTVNFSTGVIDVRLTLTQPGNGNSPPVPYGAFTARGTLSAGQNQFSGLFVPGSDRSGSFRGGFFGPQAREIGIAFAGSVTSPTLNDRFVGSIVGRRP